MRLNVVALSSAFFLLTTLTLETDAIGVVSSIKKGITAPVDTAKSVGEKAGQKVTSIGEKAGEKAKDVGEKAKDVGDKVKDAADKVPEVVGEVAEHIPDPVEVVKNISDLVATTAVFVKNNVTLNCFGLPVLEFTKILENIFTQKTEARDVKFYFSNAARTGNVTVRLDQPFDLQNIDFDVSRPTVVLVHGFMSSGQEKWIKDLKDAFLQLGNINVIVVDWQRGSNTWNYYSAAISTRIVGEETAKLFAKIRDLGRASRSAPKLDGWGSLYFVGHSLGSHISAHAAHLIKKSQENNNAKWIVRRIIALDPAQPCFTEADLELKLDRQDAPFIDVIHTNARHILFLGLGLPDQLGHIDFYPNGGKAQPGCSDIDVSFWSFLLLPVNIIQEAICSHGRSHTFLTESIVDSVTGNCTFVGYQWDRSTEHEPSILREKCMKGQCTEMGINSIFYYPKSNGTYFVPTRSSYPYCGPDDKEQIEAREGSKSIFTKITKKIF
ncbi:hypothetical protein QAD02_008513 [Eretmocerus hayati]|uniref:Uncharacterized protein n=1 Tax=Eretmocerus hayati TaxID=131215 RepID=A0ACC2N825_9HYME|nr:hypothetical protein QAD02_008513 [Eretmocerus hayati]